MRNNRSVHSLSMPEPPPPSRAVPTPSVRAVFGTWTCTGPGAGPMVVDDDAYAAVKAGACLGQCLLLGESCHAVSAAITMLDVHSCTNVSHTAHQPEQGERSNARACPEGLSQPDSRDRPQRRDA